MNKENTDTKSLAHTKWNCKYHITQIIVSRCCRWEFEHIQFTVIYNRDFATVCTGICFVSLIKICKVYSQLHRLLCKTEIFVSQIPCLVGSDIAADFCDINIALQMIFLSKC